MANGENQKLDYGRELVYVDQHDQYLGRLLKRVIDGVNTLATNAGVSAVGKTAPPPKIDSITVQGTLAGNTITCPSEILHHVLVHNQSVQKGIKYFSEIDTSPNFPQPHVIDHGTSRSSFLTLPTYSSVANQTATPPVPTNYYLRSYAQGPGSDPCEPTVLGGLNGATVINMTPPTGSTGSVTPLLSSTGSGTAQSTGQQGGKGLGTVLQRPTPQAKRQLVKH
jgi:hypothetical protein